jgi:hypothetical protein
MYQKLAAPGDRDTGFISSTQFEPCVYWRWKENEQCTESECDDSVPTVWQQCDNLGGDFGANNGIEVI